MTAYRTVIESHPDGMWTADFPDVPGCHTQARTVAKLLDRAREILGSFVDLEDDDVLDLDLVDVDPTARWALANYLGERQLHDVDRARRDRDLAMAAHRLSSQGWSLRDVAAVMQVHHTRVHQLVQAWRAGEMEEPPAARERWTILTD